MKTKLTLFILLSFFSSFIAAQGLVDLTNEQLVEMQTNKNALVIDIRTKKEWNATGTIPGSHKLQFFSSEGKFDTEKWLADLNKLKSSPGQPVILVCRSGGRSGMLGNMLTKQQEMNNIHHLSNGFKTWEKAGNKISKD